MCGNFEINAAATNWPGLTTCCQWAQENHRNKRTQPRSKVYQKLPVPCPSILTLSRKGEKTFHFLSKHGSRLALPLQQFAAPVIGHYAVAGCPTSTPNRLALWAFPKSTKCPLHLESAMEMSRVTTLLKPSNFQSISSTTSNYWHWKNPACQDYVFEKKHLPSCLFTGETLKLWNIQHMVLKSLAHLPTVC